ncbi:hypothetical protein CVU82_03455 [Candidatus Falkowbacteria bacterium HGW-Falkowbacteria-1]|jgi:hypothetical protein|uniref:Uncharacterized protein n=1 Tax=Candidatus Falkowbacteria bacterium HGW-Falkowbacteria-1 TaxID=2013768 RepID=A0A2N2E8S9_9BACT|nr:MAG: hypothetical protein CVU82_03455 [Candidatus Falkowbacteria bacterium HGW-Falkowbacteria-1]
MENKSLQFLQKLKSLPEEVNIYFSSDINSKIIEELADKYNLELDLVHDILIDFFIFDFQIEKLYKNISDKIINKNDSNNFVCDFLGKLFLPVGPFIDFKVEEEIKKYKGQVDVYKKYIDDFNDLIDDENFDNLGDFLEGFENDFDENEEERMSAYFLEKNLVEILENNDPSASQKVNGSLLYLLINKSDSLSKFTRAFLINQEKLTKNLLIIEGKKEDPTIANWVKSFVKENGSDLFNNIILAKYLTSSINCLSIDNDERKLVRKTLRLYRNLIFFPDSMKNIPMEEWEIIPVDKDSVYSDDSMAKLRKASFSQEALKQKDKEKEIRPSESLVGGSLKISYENIKTEQTKKFENNTTDIEKIKELELMLGKYSGKNLERKAIENEIKKLKKTK